LTRKMHQSIDLVLSGVGVVLIFAAVLQSRDSSLQVQILMVGVGLLLSNAGICGFATRLVLNERRFGALRQKGDHMITLIRRLHRAALDRDHGESGDARFEMVLREMHDTVRLMADLASIEDGQALPQPVVDEEGSPPQLV